MRKLFFAFMLFAILLAACTATQDPEPQEEPLIDSMDDQSEPVETEDATPPAIEPANEDEPEVTKVAPSGTVNLQELTPSVPGSGENIVMPAPGVPNPAARVVQLAKAKLAAFSGLDIDEIKLISVEEVTWPDSSLGCPEAGMMYLQVLTPGFKIFLEAGKGPVRYHSDSGAVVRRCDNPTSDGLPSTDK